MSDTFPLLSYPDPKIKAKNSDVDLSDTALLDTIEKVRKSVNADIEKLLADTHDPEKFDPRSVPPELKRLDAELR